MEEMKKKQAEETRRECILHSRGCSALTRGGGGLDAGKDGKAKRMRDSSLRSE
jgi:hypothetical protein